MSLLPTKKSELVTDLSNAKMLIHGPPKIGKSTFASQIPDTLFLATEQGLDFLKVYKADISDWQKLLDAGKELDGTQKFKSVVLDTVNNAHQMCQDFICKKHKISHPQDLDYGKGWGLVNHEFKRVITRLSHQGRGLLLICHSQEKTIKTNTAEITRVVPTLPGSARDFILGLVDVILFAEAVETEGGTKRILHATPSENWIAGDRTGKLPEIMPLDYKAVAKAFKEAK